MQIQHWLVLAGFFGLTPTMLRAYGAHGLAATGIAPSLLAAFQHRRAIPVFPRPGLLVLGLCGVRGKVITFAGAVFVLGILGFSGSIYAMVLLGSKGLGSSPGRWPLFYVGMGGSDVGRLSSWRKRMNKPCCGPLPPGF